MVKRVLKILRKPRVKLSEIAVRAAFDKVALADQDGYDRGWQVGYHTARREYGPVETLKEPIGDLIASVDNWRMDEDGAVLMNATDLKKFANLDLRYGAFKLMIGELKRLGYGK